MSRFNELLDAGTSHRVSIKNQKGKTLIKMPLILAVIIFIGAPQLLVVVLAGMALELIKVEYDERPLQID